MTCSVHHVPGRLRVKIAGIKHQEHQAKKVQNLFSGLYGIDKISVNTLTGSVVLYYDPSVFSVDQLLNIFKYNNVIDSNQRIVFEEPVSETFNQMGWPLEKPYLVGQWEKPWNEAVLGF
jgi:hypothetical protein